ncbi:MAG: tRNA (N(6)-L-threonylcarbamoyladenosine(37)-C(2))-methylthiotransferase MtaB [Candidatus Aerophobetes bacterium]|nr:tRNA (N(6)-L-threonylcarbamoyladenosine(37)-C(2))-methylthiotransferase MtaB [Candidatus Aerophobetes bacterium]
MKNCRTVALATLGCKVNQYETEFIRERLEESGFVIVPFKGKADIYIINTCTVTQKAARKSRELINQVKKRNKEAFLILTGCYAQAEGESLKKRFPWIDLVVENEDKLKIDRLMEPEGETLTSRNSFIHTFHNHNRAFVKIEDGCNQFCNYCIIPYVRGDKIRSRRSGEIIAEIKGLVKNGFKEIVLGGINLALYGEDLTSRASLVNFLKMISSLKEDNIRIRLSSLEPHLITEELIDFIADSSLVCPHFHFPLQSGDKKVLKRMGRRYTPCEYRNLVGKIRKKIPSVAITTDIIVGFPGEGEKEFLNTYHFLEDIKFSRLHIFRFSPRKGTSACSMGPRVTERVKRERSKKLREMGKIHSLEFASHFLNRSLRVLVEEKRDSLSGLLTGYTDNYIRVFIRGEENLKNRLVKVRLTEIKENKVRGQVFKLHIS